LNKCILITIKKELRSILRDKKTITRMLLFPLIIPLMIMLYGTMYDTIEETEDITYKIGIDYKVEEKEKAILDSLKIEYMTCENKECLDTSYNNKEIEGYVSYNQESNTYQIYTDSSTTNGMRISTIIEEYLNSYSTLLTNTYLTSQNIDLEKTYNHFNIDYIDLGTSNYMLSILLSVSFTYIIMAICMATSSMATGVTATERENGTLETILTFPIKKTDLLTGKYLSSVMLGFISSLIGFLLTIASLIIGKHIYTMFDGFELILSVKTIIGSLVVIICASFFIAGVALALTSFSKNYKEAQSATALLNMVCLIPMFVSLIEMELTNMYYIIPICNFEQVLMDLFTNNCSLTGILLTIGSTLIYIIGILFYIIKSYNSEKILFAK